MLLYLFGIWTFLCFLAGLDLFFLKFQTVLAIEKHESNVIVISLKFHLLPCSLCTLRVKKRLEGSSGQMFGKAAWLKLC